jgi:ankyrin repeat protein
MIAAVNGHVDIVRMLLEAGADPRAVNEEGRTALELAEAAGQPEVVNLLRQPQVREGR